VCFLEGSPCDREAKGRRQSADLWLAFRNPTELRVTNIVPTASWELSNAQYNDILREFADRFVRPVAEVLISKPELSLKDLAPPEVAKKRCSAFRMPRTKRPVSAHPSGRV